MSKYSVSADCPEYSAKERRRWYRNKPQREASASQRGCQGRFGRAGARSWSLMFVRRAGSGVGRKCLEVASSAHTGPGSLLGRPLQPRLCLGSWLSCFLELACRDLQVGTLEACSTVFRERMVPSAPKHSTLTQSARHGCPRAAPPTQCLCEVLSLSTCLLSSI